MKFTHTDDDVYGNQIESITVELHQHATLEELLETFTRFVRACGYHFEGDIDIVNTLYEEDAGLKYNYVEAYDETVVDQFDEIDDDLKAKADWPFPLSTKP